MNRESYFEELRSTQSPLLLLPEKIPGLIKARENDSEASLKVYLSFANELEQFDSEPAKTRAAFISLQCRGINTEDMFYAYSESWGIPRFDEGLVLHEDFKNGFLWTFRDHSSSWNEDEEARNWFYTHIEGRFARRYEYYSQDHGVDELLLIESGDFKHILQLIVNKHVDLSALVSPVFSKDELQHFYSKFDGAQYGVNKKEVMNFIRQNPNW